MKKLRIALAPFQVEFGSISSNQAHLFTALHNATEQRADLIIFPEYCLSGFDYTDEQLSIQYAVNIKDNSVINRLKTHSRRFGVDIVLGILERQDNRIFNSAIVISCGNIAGKYHKLQEGGLITPGKTVMVMETPHISRLCCILCGDLYHPVVIAQLQLLQPQLVCIPMFRNLGKADTCRHYVTACDSLCKEDDAMSCYIMGYKNEKDAWRQRVRHDIARQVRLYGSDTCIVNGYDTNATEGCGGALYVGASGKIHAELGYGQTGVLIVERDIF